MNVPLGPSSWLGYLTAAAGALTSGLVALTGTEAQLHGPGKWAAILGAIALVATNAGRQLQAYGQTRTPPPSARPQSAATPDGATTTDGEPV
jgi:hypothetical protein